MKAELAAMEEHGVFGSGEVKLLELPVARKALPRHWVFKAKRDDSGKIKKFKARLICGGNHQTEGIDFSATYAPTARLAHIRLMLAIAAKYDFDLHEMDVMTAFLGGKLTKEIYMHPPQGFFRLQSIFKPNGGGKGGVLHLYRSLYGLRQAANVFYNVFKSHLLNIAFVPSKVDAGFFFLYDNKENLHATIVLRVDDVMIAAHPEVILSIKEKLTARFKMHDLGPIRYYLGMLVERDRDSKVLYLSLPSYVDAILERFGMKERKMLSTPMDGRFHKKKEEELAADKQEYQILLGSLMYLSTATRPDLAYALMPLSIRS
jgi:hypothetical protein